MKTSYKGRLVNPHVPVEVYRNLHRGGYSIRQGGLVVAHAENVTLMDATFVVKRAGWNLFQKTKRRTVHAWITGTLLSTREQRPLTTRVTYTPFSGPQFRSPDGDVLTARLVVLNMGGVTAWRINDE